MTGPGGDPSPAPPPEEILLVRDEEGVEALARRCAGAERVALDVESNGLFAYRPALCTVQLAFAHAGGTVIAVVDTLATGLGPLAGVLGRDGPIKVLHDLTFDAKLLAESGVPIARLRDTSVAARLLGATATGLGALLGGLGVVVDKKLQQHDWTRRPLTPSQLAYLANDVRHLLELDDHLAARAAALGIDEEIAAECAYKLSTATLPARDARPSYVRVKGLGTLAPVERAVLRRLFEVRETAAAQGDVPPFKVVTAEVLMAVARRRPTTQGELRAIPGAASGRASRLAGAFLGAVAQGVLDGDLPPEDLALLQPAPVDRAEVARRRARETQVTAWRRAEARRRGVDEQAVLPGHCAQDLAQALASHGEADAALVTAIAAIPGLGACRLARYGEAWRALATSLPRGPAPPAGEASSAPGASDQEPGSGGDPSLAPPSPE